MQIEQGKKLDFDDVLIKPKYTNISSRANVNLIRTFKTLNSKTELTCCPIIAANLDTVGTMSMCRALAEFQMLTCLHKFYPEDKLIDFFNNDKSSKYAFYTLGITDKDITKLKLVSSEAKIDKICVDVACGYSSHFIKKLVVIRDLFPKAIIISGNVATQEMVQQITVNGQADIVKIGIGPGCFIKGTTVKTKKGYKKIENVKIGDEVLTHTRKYKPVVQTHQRLEKEVIIDVNGIKSTKNHKYYVVHKDDVGKVNDNNIHDYAKWVSAEELSVEYFLIEITNKS